jgi:hypothetical protein
VFGCVYRRQLQAWINGCVVIITSSSREQAENTLDRVRALMRREGRRSLANVRSARSRGKRQIPALLHDRHGSIPSIVSCPSDAPPRRLAHPVDDPSQRGAPLT